MHRDYQGSILAITNATAQLVEKRLFDVWGNIIRVQDSLNNNLAGLTFFDRGYTGHEHLQSVGLINMNARLYDPVIHRFLSPDNYIQDPYNTQNYNRYGYCVNNPTKYTDITGNVFGVGEAMIIGAAVSLASYFISTYLSGQPFTLEGMVQSAFIGAISGMVTFGIGEAAQTIGNFYLRGGIQALAHGTFQGTMAGIQGGNFWQGFASGSLSSIASSLWQGGSSFVTSDNVTEEFLHKGISGALGLNNTAGTLFFGTISGGVGASLTGGNFWQGAATGLIVSGLNHLAHSGDDEYSNEADDKPIPGNMESVNKVLNSDKRLQRLRARAGNPEYSVSDLDVSLNEGADAITRGANPYAPEEGSKPYCIFFQDAFKKGWGYLKTVMYHETGHAFNKTHGIFSNNYYSGIKLGLKLKQAYDRARDIDEILIYKATFQMLGNGLTPSYYGLIKTYKNHSQYKPNIKAMLGN